MRLIQQVSTEKVLRKFWKKKYLESGEKKLRKCLWHEMRKEGLQNQVGDHNVKVKEIYKYHRVRK